jgi:tetratricopeptide (TPR) repeat protein
MSNQNLAKQLNILLEKNLFKDSLELLELNLKQNPLLNKNPDFLNIYGLIQLNLKDWEQAIKYFKKATEIDTNFRPAYFNLGLAYYDLGKLNNAYEAFCKVLEIEKNNKRAQENIIKILHCIKINNTNGDNLVDANNELQKLEFDFDLSKKITNQKILDILDNSKSITSKYISDFTFREHQLFFHNQQDLNCERHFRIFRQQNTISNKCFSCYKVIIKLFDVNDLIRLIFHF